MGFSLFVELPVSITLNGHNDFVYILWVFNGENVRQGEYDLIYLCPVFCIQSLFIMISRSLCMLVIDHVS